MNRTAKRCLALLLTLGFVGGMPSAFTATAEDQNGFPNAEVWATYGSAKVVQDPSLNGNHTHFDAVIDVSASRGEKEDGQLIVTATKDISAYTLKTAALTSEDGSTFALENIRVYNQFYHEVYLPSKNVVKEEYPLGYTPDALVPQAGSESVGENYITAGNNQGITVTFDVPVNQQPGTYTGTFELVLDGYKQKIPVRLTVWNIDNAEMHGYNVWDLWNGGVADGELNKIDYEDKQVVSQSYFDILLDNRLNSMRLPDGMADPEILADGLVKYWSNPHFNSFCFPNFYGDKSIIKSYLSSILVRADRDSINYFTAASFYEKTVDEPYSDPARMELCIEYCRNTLQALQEFALELETNTEIFEGKAELKAEVVESIKNIPFVITCPQEKLPEELRNMTNCLCPQYDYFSTDAQRTYYEDRAENTEFSTWIYTCLAPAYPLPNYHIDDFALGGRVIGWHRSQYNIEGYLHWAADMSYLQGVPGMGTRYDPYEEAIHLYVTATDFANGDGFLVYPGKRYNLSGPVGTIRLHAARDAQEDYDMLCVFKNLYNELLAKYGMDASMFDMDAMLDNLYTSISDGINYYKKVDFLYEAREYLANWMEAMTNSNVLFGYSTTEDGKAKISVVSDADEIYINGKKVKGADVLNGKQYQKLVSLQDGETIVSVKIVKDGESKLYNYKVGAKKYSLVSAADITVENLKLSTDSTYSVADGSITIKSWGESYADQLVFTPSARLKLNESVSRQDIQQLEVELTNKSSFAITVKFGYYSGTATKIVDTYLIPANSSVVISDLNVYDTNWNKDTIEGLVFNFDNLDENDNLFADRIIKIGSCVYTKK